MSFRTNINKAAPHSYELIFPKLPIESNITDKYPLVLNIHSTVIPALTLAELELGWQGGKGKTFQGGLDYEPWFVNFMVDEDFANWYLLFKWITHINDNKAFYVRKHEEFKIDASLKITDNFEQTIMTVNFLDIWITNLGEVSLTHKEGETTLNSTANFAYNRYEVSVLTT